jgi:hypothetical protein
MSLPMLKLIVTSSQRHSVLMGLLLLGFLTVPHFVFVYFGQSSVAMGLFAYAVSLLLLYAGRSRLRLNTTQWGILGIVTTSILFYRGSDLSRQLLSLAVMALIFFAANCLFRDLERQSDRALRRIVKCFFFLLLAIGINGKLSLLAPGAYAPEITVFPFYEPSHFALTFCPVACAYLLQLQGWRRLGAAGLCLAMALWYPNTTFLAGCVLMFLVILRAWLLLFGGAVLALVGAYVGFQEVERLPQYEYFASRMGGQEADDNLTYLVYVQGWEQARIAVSGTYGLGVGFQRFGREPAGETADRIESRYGVPVNRQDGSNLGTKLIGEFGLLGAMATALMVLRAGWSFFQLRKLCRRKLVRARTIDVLFLSCALMFVIEVFFRGMSYFNPMLYLYCYSVGRLTPGLARRPESWSEATALVAPVVSAPNNRLSPHESR